MREMVPAVIAILSLCVASGQSAAKSPNDGLPADATKADAQWTFATDDTHVTLALRNNRPYIDELKNPAQGWNWTPKPSEVPLPGRVLIGGKPQTLTWAYQGATVDTPRERPSRCDSSLPSRTSNSSRSGGPGRGPVPSSTTPASSTDPGPRSCLTEMTFSQPICTWWPTIRQSHFPAVCISTGAT